MSPRDAENIGVVDTENDSFYTITSGVPAGIIAYTTPVALGTKVYCAPQHQDNVLVVDTTTDTVYTITTSGVSGDYKFNGVGVYPPLVVMFPHHSSKIGILDTTTDTFSTPITVESNERHMRGKAAVIGNKMYMPPALNRGSEQPVGVLTFP